MRALVMIRSSLFQNTKRLFGRIVSSVNVVMWCCPTVALACSGDSAPGLIEHNRFVVQVFAGFP